MFLGSWDRYNTGSVVCGVVMFTWGCCRGFRRSLASRLLFLLLLLLPWGLSPVLVVSVRGHCLLSSFLLSFLLPWVVLVRRRLLPCVRLPG